MTGKIRRGKLNINRKKKKGNIKMPKDLPKQPRPMAYAAEPEFG